VTANGIWIDAFDRANLSWLKPGGMMTLKLAYLENPLVAPSDAGRKPFTWTFDWRPSSPAKASEADGGGKLDDGEYGCRNNQPRALRR